MKPLSRIESLIAEIVERPAWGLTHRKLHPLELTTALVKVLELRAVRLVDRILAPDLYVLRLNPDDLATMVDVQPVLERELAEFLTRTFEDRDLSCNLPPTVSLRGDASVRPGRIEPHASFSTIPEPSDRTIVGRPVSLPAGRAPVLRQPTASIPAAPAQSPATMAGLELLGPDGAVLRTFRLERPATIIGRRTTTDLPLLDTGISREHARIEQNGATFAVLDLDSTNGTFVNDQQVHGRTPLHHGDVLGLGRFRLRFSQP